MDTALLAQKWIHAHEEDRDGNRVFRPASYAFAPSRGRDSLDLRKGQEAVRGTPGPDDRGQSIAETWAMSGDHVLELGAAGGAGAKTSYEIVSVDRNRLVLRRK